MESMKNTIRAEKVQVFRFQNVLDGSGQKALQMTQRAYGPTSNSSTSTVPKKYPNAIQATVSLEDTLKSPIQAASGSRSSKANHL